MCYRGGGNATKLAGAFADLRGDSFISHILSFNSFKCGFIRYNKFNGASLNYTLYYLIYKLYMFTMYIKKYLLFLCLLQTTFAAFEV